MNTLRVFKKMRSIFFERAAEVRSTEMPRASAGPKGTREVWGGVPVERSGAERDIAMCPFKKKG